MRGVQGYAEKGYAVARGYFVMWEAEKSYLNLTRGTINIFRGTIYGYGKFTYAVIRDAIEIVIRDAAGVFAKSNINIQREVLWGTGRAVDYIDEGRLNRPLKKNIVVEGGFQDMVPKGFQV